MTSRDNWLYGDLQTASHPALPACRARRPNWRRAGARRPKTPRATSEATCGSNSLAEAQGDTVGERSHGWRRSSRLSPRDRENTLKLVAFDSRTTPTANRPTALYDRLLQGAAGHDLDLILVARGPRRADEPTRMRRSARDRSRGWPQKPRRRKRRPRPRWNFSSPTISMPPAKGYLRGEVTPPACGLTEPSAGPGEVSLFAKQRRNDEARRVLDELAAAQPGEPAAARSSRWMAVADASTRSRTSRDDALRNWQLAAAAQPGPDPRRCSPPSELLLMSRGDASRARRSQLEARDSMRHARRSGTRGSSSASFSRCSMSSGTVAANLTRRARFRGWMLATPAGGPEVSVFSGGVDARQARPLRP